MIQPAIFGTENVLNAVNTSPSVKRVILTSSTVSVWGDPHERGKGHVFTEADWNITAHPQKFPYFYAKTKAEERAYAMEQEAGGRWTLCSICPGAIWGPPTSSRTDGESVGQMIDLLAGETQSRKHWRGCYSGSLLSLLLTGLSMPLVMTCPVDIRWISNQVCQHSVRPANVGLL